MSERTDSDEREADAIVARSLVLAPPPAAPPDSDPFGRVRVHTGRDADAAARALDARAFAFGEHVFFAAGAFAPGSPAGERLLAHELVHVLQARAGGPPAILRNGEDAARAAGISMWVTLDGIHFDFHDLTYAEGPTRPQLTRWILRRVLGQQYTEGMEETVLPRWEAAMTEAGFRAIQDLTPTSTARAGERIREQSGPPESAVALISVLEGEMGLSTSFTPEQRELLGLGAALRRLWSSVRPRVPPWYTRPIFNRDMATHGDLLRQWHGASGAEPMLRRSIVDAVLGALLPAVEVLEDVRQDYAIANERLEETDDARVRIERGDAAAGYAWLWRVSLEGDTRLTAPPPGTRARDPATFLRYLRSQPALMGQAQGDDASAAHAARVRLMARAERFRGRATTARSTVDEALSNAPSVVNAPPLDATLTASPPLTPPLFEAALETDHAFTMSLRFPDVFEAFMWFAYRFEYIRMPDPEGMDEGAEMPDPLVADGVSPDVGRVMDARLARARRYNAEDLERVRGMFGGVPFGEAIDAVRLNNALRTVGAVIGTAIDDLFEPSKTARFVFPGPGLYIVRARAMAVLDGDEEHVRAPSVALLPVVARDPDEMAVARVEEARANEFRIRARIAEIYALFAAPFPPENAEALRGELAALEAMLSTPAEALEHRAAELDVEIERLRERERIRALLAAQRRRDEPDGAEIARLRGLLRESGGLGGAFTEPRRLRSLERQRESVGDILQMRTNRRVGEQGSLSHPHVVFVSDLGHTLPLAIEMYDRGIVGDEYQVYLSDLTTPDSGAAVGTSPLAGVDDPRAAAALAALRELLEEHSDYGRGRVSIDVGRDVHMLRVQAGSGRMLSELIDTGTVVLSIAAILAAPFTEGASLYILIPLGVIGAAPSAYRLYQRYDESRLRLDFAAVMDVANVVGGVVGLAQGATALRGVQMGRTLLIIGLGNDGAGILLMGAGIVDQLASIRSLPEHERAAAVLRILSSAMLQAGIMAGGSLMGARYEGRGGAAEGGVRETGGDAGADGAGTRPHPEPGFHPPVEEPAGPARRSDAEGHVLVDEPPAAPVEAARPGTRRTMAGSGEGPPSSESPAPRRATGAPAPAEPVASRHPESVRPERLLEEMDRGVDRTLGPPRPPPDGAELPPQGVFRRGLRTTAEARAAYESALSLSGNREVGIFWHEARGEYAVMMGSEVGVDGPGGGGWRAVVHYHPNPTNTLTYRLPAPADFAGLLEEFGRTGSLVREFVEFHLPGVGRGRTEYGIDPTHEAPYYVRVHMPTGEPMEIRFRSDGEYRRYHGSETTVVEPGSELHRAMLQDIERYLSGLERHGRDFGPGAERGRGRLGEEGMRRSPGDIEPRWDEPPRVGNEAPPAARAPTETAPGAADEARPAPQPATDVPPRPHPETTPPSEPPAAHGAATEVSPGSDPDATPAGSPDTTPGTGRTMAGTGGPSGPLMRWDGSLTEAGLRFLRERFPTTRVGRRQVRLADLPDAEVARLYQERWQWREALVVGEARLAWLGQATATDFVLADPHQTLDHVARRIRQAVEGAGSGHTVDTAVLGQSVWDYIRARLAQGDALVAPAYRALETHPDPVVRRRWREFKLSQSRGDMSGFMLGRVGDKMPDIVEVMLSRDTIIVTDVSLAYSDPIHNFKSAFYRSVIEHLIDIGTVGAMDYRSPSQTTLIGP